MRTLPLLVALSAACGSAAAYEGTARVDDERARTWNRFAEEVFALHERSVAGREVREKTTVGRYGGEAAKHYRFREVEYYDGASGRLLSRIRWDGQDAATWHVAEVFVYDDRGRLRRDYAAIYLPWTHNAPIRTFINLHRHHDEVHAFRQFDASGEPQYERCRGRLDGQSVDLSLDPYRVGEPAMRTAAYRVCFDGLPVAAGRYLSPQ